MRGPIYNIISVSLHAVNNYYLGTGASCIYPLLGTVLNRWQFLATEIDEVSVQSAKDNVYRNNLQDRIGSERRGHTHTQSIPLIVLLLNAYL